MQKPVLFRSFIPMLSLILFLAWGCNNAEQQKNVVGNFTIPKITGDTGQPGLCLAPAYMLNAWYDNERLDTITQTLNLAEKGKSMDGLGCSPYYTGPARTIRRSNEGLRIIADTVNELSMKKRPIWASYLFHANLALRDTTELLQDDTLIQQVKCFPVYIANLSSMDTAAIKMQDGSFIMQVEAMDKNGKWKPIEYWSDSWCGNSYYYVLLPPRQMYMSRAIKCSGDFKTKCRMVLHNENMTLYSNEFTMGISEKQFTKPVQTN